MFSTSFSLNSTSSKKSLLFLLLFLGIFLVGGKSWGESCGEGNKGTCKEAIDNFAQNCSFGWSPYNYDSATQCKNIGQTIYRCCIAASVCAGKSNGTACEINGKSGTCSSEVCYESNVKRKVGDPCGANDLGKCQTDCKKTSGLDGNPIYYGDSSDCENRSVCCVDECYNKADGASCDGWVSKSGTCKNKICENVLAKENEPCGKDEKGKCLIGTKDALGIPKADCKEGEPLSGGRDCPEDYWCCTTSNPSSTSCGAKNGTCSDSCVSSQTEDTSESAKATCSTQKCCYATPKPPANPDTAPKAFGYTNPLNSKTFTTWAEKVLTSIQGIVGWLAVIMIMIGGIVYLTSAGTKSATLGREIITAALIGFAAAVAGPSLLKEIKDLVSGTGTTATGAIDSAKDIKSIFTSALNFLLVAMGTLSLIGFVIGGFFYLTAFGDKSRAETGRKIATNSLYAIALAGGGLILVKQILSLLNK